MAANREHPGGVNPHVAWRMAVARRAARPYGQNPKLAAMTVAGSVGAGIADQFSDLELDCYWSAAPSDVDRADPVHALGGELMALWGYDEDDEEWSDDYRLGELDITVSSFLTSSTERFLDDVVRDADTDPVKHMRLAAVQNSRPLLGTDLVGSWQARAAGYPDKLVAAMVEQALDPRLLNGWAAREALASRGDDLALRGLLVQAGTAVIRAVLALNRVYLPHRQIKWQRHLVSGLAISPERFAERLQVLPAGAAAATLREAEALLADTVLLVEAHSSAAIGAFREALSERRPVTGPPDLADSESADHAEGAEHAGDGQHRDRGDGAANGPAAHF